VPELLEQAIALWRECPADLPEFGHTYPVGEQQSRERELDRFLEEIQSELRSLPRSRSERESVQGRISEAFVRLAQSALDLTPAHLDLLLAGGFSGIGTELGRRARRLAFPATVADIIQASRNAWTACGLQILLGAEMRLTPSIFAYSMLYPATDNYMDDPAVRREAKLGFSQRFGQRLAGHAVPPVNDRETNIWCLVALIEEEHAREARPQVFESLLMIHDAQQESLRLVRRRAPHEAVDILSLSFRKGGASVLADGVLARASLSAAEARFAYNWGVFLQLADDLQDVREDSRDGVLTLFSDAAGREPLDELTNRTFHFARRVMHQMEELPTCGPAATAPRLRALKELIRGSATSVLIRSAGEAGEFFSREYLAALEAHSPFRFAFLNDRRQQMARRGVLMGRLFEAFLAGEDDEPVFPLLPSSLLPR
jgi:hypothetical protein